MAQNKTRIIMIETNNPETLEIKRKNNIPIKTINVRSGDYTVIRSIGDDASILRNDERNTFSIEHTYIDDMIFINADEAEQMAWDLFAAADELRKIEREHATDKGK